MTLLGLKIIFNFLDIKSDQFGDWRLVIKRNIIEEKHRKGMCESFGHIQYLKLKQRLKKKKIP